MTYDILVYNNSTKAYNLWQGMEDKSNNKLYHTFDLDLSSLSSGEYTAYIIRNDYGSEVVWTVSDVPLNSILEYEEKQYKLIDLKPEINLLKLGTEATTDKSTYKKKNVEYAYRKREI